MARRVSKRKMPDRDKYRVNERWKIEEGVFDRKTMMNIEGDDADFRLSDNVILGTILKLYYDFNIHLIDLVPCLCEVDIGFLAFRYYVDHSGSDAMGEDLLYVHHSLPVEYALLYLPPFINPVLIPVGHLSLANPSCHVYTDD